MSLTPAAPPLGAAPRDLMDATRDEILRHAQELFAHYGYAKTSMADIAGRCGMSPGNLYRYHRNKQAIGVAVIEAFFRQSEAAMEAAMAPAAGPEARIRALITEGVRQLVAEMDVSPKIMEMVEFMTSEDEAHASLDAHIAWKRGRVEAELARGMAEGRFIALPVYETAVNLMHATKAFQMPQSLAAWRDRATILPELEGVLDLVFTGLRVRR